MKKIILCLTLFVSVFAFSKAAPTPVKCKTKKDCHIVVKEQQCCGLRVTVSNKSGGPIVNEEQAKPLSEECKSIIVDCPDPAFAEGVECISNVCVLDQDVHSRSACEKGYGMKSVCRARFMK